MNDSDRLARLEGTVHVTDVAALRALLRRPLDFGCRPRVLPAPVGGFTVPLIGSAEDFDKLEADGFEVTSRNAPPDRVLDVGQGDRFAGGQIVPRSRDFHDQ
jgi:hypothetical protein